MPSSEPDNHADNNSVKVLVVEDEASIRRGLCDVLAFRGYTVSSAADGRSGLELASSGEFDLLMLDVMLPELDGFTLCEKVRERGHQTPILMLTAKGSEDDVLHGFEVGADDYVTKPFSVRELVARVEVLLKRSRRIVRDQFRVGRFEVHPSEGLAKHQNQHDVVLSSKEIRILKLLADERGRVVSRRVLLRDVWHVNNADLMQTRTVDVHIAKLRKKLGESGSTLVQTVRGQGYRLWEADL